MFRNSNSDNKEYQLYLQKIVKKGDKVLVQFQAYLQKQIETFGDIHAASIIQYFIYISVHPTLSLPQKSALIQVFEHICYVIKDLPQLTGYISQLVGCILKYFNDPLQKIRYSAISSLYNVFKFLDDDCLFVFTRTFKELPCVVTDPYPQVKQAALHLNHTMKTLLNNAILDNRDFDFEDFINILTQNFLLPHPAVKQFLIDWINTLDQIKCFDSTHYLPLFLKKIFVFLVDQNKNVRNKANDCLKGFIDSFRLSFICSKEAITNRYQQQDTQAILILLVKIIEQSIVFEVSSQIDVHVLNWLESFSDFLVEQINLGLEPFLVKIFSNIFKPLFKVMIQAMSIQCQNVRKTSSKIHENLLKAYPFILEINPDVQSAAICLKSSMATSKTLLKTQVIIKWLIQMGKYNNQAVHGEIDMYIIYLVQKICESSYRNLSTIIPLLSKSIFTTEYFAKLLQALIMHLQLRKVPYESNIIHKILCLPQSDPIQSFIMICRQLNQLSDVAKGSFKLRIAEILFSFLITDKCLNKLLFSLLNGEVPQNIVSQISKVFVDNSGVFLGFAFLFKNYPLVINIIENLSQQHLSHQQISSITKISNYLLHPSLHSIFIDIEGTSTDSQYARQAYLHLIMLLPMNKYTQSLQQKLIYFSEEQSDSEEEIVQSIDNKINANLKQEDKKQSSYLELISKVYLQHIIQGQQSVQQTIL